MTTPRWSLTDAAAAVSSPDLRHDVGAAAGSPAVVLEPDPTDDRTAWARIEARLRPLAVVAVSTAPDVGDVHGDIDSLVAAVQTMPRAATIAAQLLRLAPTEPHAAIQMESLAYATLQAGPEHAVWLAEQGRRVRRDDAPRVHLDDRDGITITLSRPRLHNLLDRRGRDELAAAFETAVLLDDTPIRWVGDGPSFCAGGDPAEFGMVADPATAHTIRAAASPAGPLLAIAERMTAHVHGACVGAGIELAAFAQTLIADPGTRFRLPELTMGLIPGVGGTWSIARRIGRRRLLEWLLRDLELDAATALEWGLIEAIVPRE